jgi:hypothetical protein
MELKPGQRALHDILSKLAAEGREATQDQRDLLLTLAMEIDELYEQILQNQANFGDPGILLEKATPCALEVGETWAWVDGERVDIAYVTDVCQVTSTITVKRNHDPSL